VKSFTRCRANRFYLRKRFRLALTGSFAPAILRAPMAGGHAEGWSGMGTAWSIIGTLFAGILVWGGIGFLLDRWLDLRWLFLPVAW